MIKLAIQYYSIHNILTMKKSVLLIAICLAAFSCKNNTESTEENIQETTKEIAYASFGDEINDSDVFSAETIMEKYKNMKVGDTLTSKIKGEIKEVCSKKGCWMKVDVDGANEVMVTFKDYGFFMPLNAEGHVVLNGKAYITETSVEELKHYAEDAGKPTEEIAAITEPKLEYRFEADGVLLEE
ncbi:uncharacterized protein DUF4920 [Winogradskyella epiphytica]|uniref:Uncharacterized protein DUF4920 n=2 Tax=Winogradskyella epiphytica TaxID=262005 RepID=A0A2V4XYP2_9FLAO|nr:uncharacterized protein DUF4920 [Winogradskyella epiphytica]